MIKNNNAALYNLKSILSKKGGTKNTPGSIAFSQQSSIQLTPLQRLYKKSNTFK